jgi:hypothetical protein
VYVVFATVGYDTARLHYNRSVLTPDGKRVPRHFVTNTDVVAKLQAAMPGLEFVHRELDHSPAGYQRLLGEIQQFKESIDGLVLVGGATITMQGIDSAGGQPLAFTGLPTIYVDNLFKLQPLSYKTCKSRGRVILAEIDREAILPPDKSEAMFQDLVEKVRIFDALHRLREAKVLFIKDPSVDIDHVDFKTLPPRYNDMIVGRIKECFGIDFVFRDVEDLLAQYRSVTDDEARPLAEKWMAEADAVQPNLEGEVMKSARLYVAIERIKNETLDVTPAAIMISGEYRVVEEGVTTTTSLPMMEFHKQGIIGCYQSYTGTTLAELLGYYLVGRMSFVHDDVVDLANNITHHMHCGTPINNVWGTKNLRYKIRDYTTGKWHEDRKHRDGAVPSEASFPVGVPVTIWKVFPLRKRITLYTGTSVDGEAMYREWKDIICRNKLPIKVDDAAKILSRHDVLEYGCHRVATFGDLRERVKQLATFIDFEVEEWDR